MKDPLPAKLRKTVDLAEVAVTVRRTVLSGAFASTDCSEWKTPPFKLIPFISSTFTDTGAERNYLQDLLYEMRTEANKHGMYQAFNLCDQTSPSFPAINQIFRLYLWTCDGVFEMKTLPST